MYEVVRGQEDEDGENFEDEHPADLLFFWVHIGLAIASGCISKPVSQNYRLYTL